ncbi:uncharacterized protein FOMMEDRAFT_105495 [Fomitiporia mediterranea MF3/22]|uniref:uncharacterized protein n=1 Tax=Fomitiporia mediterranea (strain MF3/22) TaxID=694068 RepID=UPI0004409095|nr:uncharacterized protein FOMMEDRAFT_105495 [Fomitiporia mediterranea MF3/22]EJD05264.1 hypothetical protein FOMMEDRAFT_105495 [Fomitiporia mediterranea MF3/22]
MPAPEVDTSTISARPALGHVNLMVDTLIANASLDDLRTIVRSMLATSPPSVAACFVSAARGCLSQSMERGISKQPVLFEQRERHGRVEITPSACLTSLLSYTRTLYGAGMGFESLDTLSRIVHATAGLRWDADDRLVLDLAIIDADVSQAIQSCREEYTAGNVRDINTARTALRKLRAALTECRAEVESWGGEFPFYRGSANADYLHL